MNVREYVERSRREQGLPPRITDPGVLARMAAALVAEPAPAPKRKTRKGSEVAA